MNNIFLKRITIFLLILSLLAVNLCGCNKGESVVVTESTSIVGNSGSEDIKPSEKNNSSGDSTTVTTSKVTNSSKVSDSINQSSDNKNNQSIASSGSNENNSGGIALSQEEMRYKPTSLTVTLYDSQNSVYGFTFNTTEKPIEPAIQIKKSNEKVWNEVYPSTVKSRAYKSHNSNYEYYISKAQIKLEPNCTYIYRVCDMGASLQFNKDISTPETVLKTKNTKAKSFKFVNVTDTQEAPAYFKRVLSSVINKADFLLHTGDIVQASIEELWTDMLDTNFEHLSSIPIMPIAGNHEMTNGASGELFKHFNNGLPKQSSTGWGYFYSFVYGDVKFIMLNTNDITDNQLKSEQYNWLIDELKTNTCKWTIVSMHYPLYSLNTSMVGLQNQLKGVFADYGVDVVIQGHDHTISRTYPIDKNGVPQKETVKNINGVEYSLNPNGVIYVVNGISGVQASKPGNYDKTLYKYGVSGEPASWAEFDIDNDTLTVTVKYANGKNDEVYYKWGIKKS